MNSSEGEPIAPFHKLSPPMVLGEAPIHRPSDNTLHYVDCLQEPAELHILRLDPATGNALDSPRKIILEDSVTVHFFRKGKPGSYIVAYYQGVAFLDENTGKLDIQREIIPKSERDNLRFNDGGVDSRGRFWLAEIDKKAMAYGPNKLPASYGTPKGRLWRYDPDGSLHHMESGIICGNGLAWSPDDKTMYLNDSVAGLVYAYDFESESGSITNKRIFIDRRKDGGEPDGMVADTEGNLWIAMWGTHRVMAYDKNGKLFKEINFTAKNMACTTWVGKDELYIVSATDRSGNRASNDDGGHLFRCKIAGYTGIVKNEFAG